MAEQPTPDRGSADALPPRSQPPPAPLPPARAARPSFREDFDTISKVMGWVALGLVAPSLAGPVLLVKAVSLAAGVGGNPVQSTLDDAGVLWEAALRTAPLTAAVAIMGIAVLRKWFANPLQMVMVAAVALLCTTLAAGFVDSAFTTRFARIMPARLSGNPFEFIVQLVGIYVTLYGARYVIAGGVVGGFLAWAWACRLLPHFAKGSASP